MVFDAIYFDMDGTIANLYAVENWEPKLRSSDPSPYADAVPMVDMDALNKLCEAFATKGVTIGIITWLAMDADKSYDDAVREAKMEWLQTHFPCFSECHMVKYGTTKLSTARCKNSILVDDNAKVRAGWHGYAAIDATKDILEELKKYLDMLG